MTDKSLTTKIFANGVVSAGPLSERCFYQLLITDNGGVGVPYGRAEIAHIIAELEQLQQASSDPRLPDIEAPFDPAIYIRVRSQLGYRDYISGDKKCWVTVPASRHPEAKTLYSSHVDFWLSEWAHRQHSEEALRPLVFDYMVAAGRIGEAAAVPADL